MEMASWRRRSLIWFRKGEHLSRGHFKSRYLEPGSRSGKSALGVGSAGGLEGLTVPPRWQSKYFSND